MDRQGNHAQEHETNYSAKRDAHVEALTAGTTGLIAIRWERGVNGFELSATNALWNAA
jgi:hypothetical protein